MSELSGEAAEVHARLAAYLADRAVADTLLGIQLFWLEGALRNLPLAAVDAAVQKLVKEGALECVPMADGKTLYRREPRPERATAPSPMKRQPS